MEEAFGGDTVAAVSQGASGDQNPLYLRAATNALTSRSGVPITGNMLTREPVEAPLRDGKVTQHPLDPAVRHALEKVMESEGVLLGEEVIRVMTNITDLQNQDGDTVNLRLGVLRLGDVVIGSVDGEVYSAIARKWKEESPMADSMMVTLANGMANSGYIPDNASFGAHTFQVLRTRLAAAS